MYLLKLHKALLISILICTSGFSQIYNTKVEAKINLVNKSEFIEITGTAFNKSESSQSVRYVLSVIKNNPLNSNKSKNDQSGRFVLEPGKKLLLSTTSINAFDKDRIIILLLLFDTNDEILGKDRIVINGTKEEMIKENIANVKENETLDAKYEAADGLILRGIVIDETRTKAGRDFYNMFYSLYSGKRINGEKIVTIKEVLIMANTTVISVKVGDVEIHSFISKPQNDYIKSASEISIYKVDQYFQKIKKDKHSIKHY